VLLAVRYVYSTTSPFHDMLGRSGDCEDSDLARDRESRSSGGGIGWGLERWISIGLPRPCCCPNGCDVLGLPVRGAEKWPPYGYRSLGAGESGDARLELVMLPAGLYVIPPNPGVRPVGEECS
jgi:hypothetical protein